MKNELRIGNYMDWRQFGSVKVNKTMLYRYQGFDDAKPIPLSEYWLLKFGFKKHGRFFKKSNLKITFRDCWRFEYGGLIVKIEYVHRLQNLYFELKNEEL
jgi:hypothetical protein